MFKFEHLRRSPEQSPVSTPGELATDGSNLPSRLNYLQSNDASAFHSVTEFMSRAFPGIGSLRARLDGAGNPPVALAAFEQSAAGARYDFRLHDKGSGIEQLLILAVHLAASEHHIVLIEEPESHLHPGAQREFARWLRQLADRGWQFIISTHSPVFINEAGDSAAIVWVNKRDGRTSVLPWNQRPEGDKAEATRLLAELGVQPSDALLYNSLLLVEGPSDCDVFRFLLERHAGDHRPLQVGITHYEGGRGKAVVRYLSDKLDDALSRFAQLPVKIVRDRGALGEKEIESLGKLPNVHVLERYELENYLLNPAGTAQYIQQRIERNAPRNAEFGRADATKANVERLLREAAASCAPLVCVKRSRDRIKDRLFDLMKKLDDAEGDVRKTVVSGNALSCSDSWFGALDGISFLKWEEIVKAERDKCAEEAEGGHADSAGIAPNEVPGSMILKCLLGRFGLDYKKARDAGPLAACMPDGHWQDGGDGAELRQIVESLLQVSDKA
jgi:hypothetical protein